jgi:DNA (cytosine-5)-methyltransferase 1
VEVAGCSVGYSRAGFDVYGVDILPHADYPFPMHVGDAVATLAALKSGEAVAFTQPGSGVEALRLEDFAAIHASPPCPRYSVATPDSYRDSHPDLLGPILALLSDVPMPWVVENVPGAPMPAALTVMICGRAMGLRWTKRHRLFASSIALMSPGCACSGEAPFGVTGDSPEIRDYGRNGRKARSVAHAQEVMGIDWMTRWSDLADAIPPVYTQYIGEQLMDALVVA